MSTPADSADGCSDTLLPSGGHHPLPDHGKFHPEDRIYRLRPMSRLVFVNRYYYPDESATSLMASDLATGLARCGHEVVVVTSRQGADDPRVQLPATETIGGVEIVRIRTSRFGRSSLAGRALDYLTFYISGFLALRRILRKNDLLVAMTDPPLFSVVAVAVTRRRGTRLINWIQDLYPETATALGVLSTDGQIAGILTRWRDRALQAAIDNVAIGEQMAARLRNLGVPADRVTVIPNWADGEAIVPLGRRDNPLRGTWVQDDAFVVAYSGNMGRAHDLEGLLGAASQIAAAATLPGGTSAARVQLLFIGSGHQQPRLEAEAANRGLENIVFRPFQHRSRLRQTLGVADLHVVALKPGLDGLIVPSKLYGALAAGRPVLFLGSTDSEVSKLLEAHDCGTTADPDDVTLITETIIAYAADPERCRQQGENARRLFEEAFTRDIAVSAWSELLDALARSGRGDNASRDPVGQVARRL